MTATTASKTTTSNAPHRGKGKPTTKTARLFAIFRQEGRDIPLDLMRSMYWLRYHADLGERDPIFYRVRSQFLDEMAKESANPNVSDRPSPATPAPKPGNGVEAKPTTTTTVPTTATWVVTRDVPGGISVSKVKVPPGPKPPRRPATPGHFDELIMSARLPILSLAASIGGLGALRRVVDELIAGLAPEIAGEAKS
jgi:hypothetical protein